MMALSRAYIEQARLELGEDEEKREECLRQFRIWLDNHGFIKNCRNGKTNNKKKQLIN